ncbi:hypothetical protein [Microbacterium rhizomatis]|uniref:Uncharacterized protein n=1 Tax=Microbacterium rhizomatis TaxID=1631477 RepID=A0A5J5J1Q6_9MICO|nr:hypothetical protein [Microbacterium rhizomatis]KAA9108307.1 hypothetical protein F6B43_13010 [Microbacterium rhizomatis]
MSGRTRIGALAAAFLTLTLAVAITGCAGDAPRPRPSATALPSGVSATMMQLPSDVATRQAQILVHNSSEEELTISSVRVDDPRFAGVARRLDGLVSTISPGVTADIRIQLPLMKCAADDGSTATSTPTPDPVPLATATTAPSASPSPSPSSTATMTGPPSTTTVTVHYQLGASIATATEPVSTPVPFLEDLYDRECLAEQVAKTASLSISSFTGSAQGQPADLALSIRPTGLGAARIVSIVSTTALGFDNGAGGTATAFPIGVEATTAGAPTVVHVPVRPARCDALALRDDRAATLFSLTVELDGTPGEIDLGMSADVRDEILGWARTWCGIAP